MFHFLLTFIRPHHLIHSFRQKKIDIDITKEEKGISDKIEYDIRCPLCLNTMIEPITIDFNHTFCLKCIEYALIYNMICPLCRLKIKTPLEVLLSKKINILEPSMDVNNDDWKNKNV